MTRLVATLFITVFALSAQSRRAAHPAPKKSEGEPQGPIVTLVVKGNERIPSAAVLGMSEVKIGDLATKERFDAAQKRILDSGFFDRVDYSFEAVTSPRPGFAATFQVAEAKPLYPVHFAGFPATAEELGSYLKSRDPLYNGYAPPTEPILNRWSKYFEQWAASHNEPKKVVGKLLTTASGDFYIQFQPDEPLPAVARLEFSGNHAIDSQVLQNRLGAVAFGLPYSEQTFREFLQHQVRPMYEGLGYVRVQFKNITTEPAPSPVKGVLVRLEIEEGAIYKLRKVGYSGVEADYKDRFARLAALKPGDPVNFDQLKEAAEKIQKAVRRTGYIHALTQTERSVDDAAKAVDISFRIERGDLYRFGTLAIEGLDLNGTEAVRKQWGKKPGDPYNPEYPDYFLNEIRDQGLFDHLGPTRSAAKVDDNLHIADVTLRFLPEEKKGPGTDKRRSRE